MTPETRAKVKADAIFFSRPPMSDDIFDTKEVVEFASIVVEYMAWTEQRIKALMEET